MWEYDILALEWKDLLSLGHEEIDRDHKHLYILSSSIIAADRVGVSKQDIITMFEEYIAYIEGHYSREEKIMEKISYPDKDIHIRAHNLFFERMYDLITRYSRGEQNAYAEIVSYIHEHEVDHINIYDKKLVEFYQQQNINVPFFAPRAHRKK